MIRKKIPFICDIVCDESYVSATCMLLTKFLKMVSGESLDGEEVDGTQADEKRQTPGRTAAGGWRGGVVGVKQLPPAPIDWYSDRLSQHNINLIYSQDWHKKNWNRTWNGIATLSQVSKRRDEERLELQEQ